MVDVFTSEEQEELENEGLMQLVGFEVGKEIFGVDILMVREIIRSAPITPVPNSPEFVEGVINLRGDIIPVIDLRKRLNLYTEEIQKKNWILILDIEASVTGFVVDMVDEVLKIDEKTIEPAPEIVLAGLESQYIRGVVEVAGKRLMILLNFDSILLANEIKELKDSRAAK
ncbi:MAG: purine-binding chemotaxis protein CheW [Gammaproteobacteria bacterium]|nr:purine-binding chemotaxis protein CheW [Gammaproteobacteria bacterium]